MRSNGRGPAVSRMAIDGMEPDRVVEPESAEAVAELLAEAAASGAGVAPIGGGTTLSLGNPIERFNIALSTNTLNALLDYEPTDLVVSVQAGATFADVQAALAVHGQMLPVETALPERATIGGMIATARSSPRRLASGTLRDLLIGMSVAHPSGTVTKSGGMVVKNVSGYDMSRVYHGSLGTLGVIVSANFKVVPRPRSDLTLVGRPLSLDAALDMVALLQQKGLPFIALELVTDQGQWRVAVRVEGRERSVVTLGERVADVLGGDGERLEGESSGAWWQTYLDEQSVVPEHAVMVRCSVRPRETPELVRSIERTLRDDAFSNAHVWASPGLGTVVARLACRTVNEASVAQCRSALRALDQQATHRVVLAAPEGVKAGIDVWGPPPETLDLMRALKQQFDPGRVLNPGRFIGRI